MQHIQNQFNNDQSRSLKINQRWNIIQQAIQMEENQRSSYVMDNLRELENMIVKNNMIQSTKQKLTNDQLDNLKNKCCMINQSALSGPIKEGQAKEALQNRTNHYVNQYQQKGDDFNKDISQNSHRRINDATNCFQNQHQKITNRTTQNSKHILKQAEQLKNLIFNEKTKTNEKLNQIKSTINQQTQKIESCIQEMKSCRAQNERKLETMIQDLDILLNGIVDQQLKAGQVTYDCLLKLFQDTCSKMQSKMIQ